MQNTQGLAEAFLTIIESAAAKQDPNLLVQTLLAVQKAAAAETPAPVPTPVRKRPEPTDSLEPAVAEPPAKVGRVDKPPESSTALALVDEVPRKGSGSHEVTTEATMNETNQKGGDQEKGAPDKAENVETPQDTAQPDPPAPARKLAKQMGRQAGFGKMYQNIYVLIRTCLRVFLLGYTHLVPEERLLLAAKAVIRRMVAPHKKRKEFEAPAHVKSAWENSSDRTYLAQVLRDCNFNKALGFSKA